ncbi:hypothetical protein ABPG74_002059 [Tetrahymena malaccensis]
MSFGYLVSSKMDKSLKSLDYEHTLNQTLIDISQEEKQDYHTVNRINQVLNQSKLNKKQQTYQLDERYDKCLMDKDYSELIINATINKLCQEYEVFFSKKSPILQNLEGNTFTLQKFLSLQNTKEESENFINRRYTSFIFNLSSNFFIAVFSVVLICIFGFIGGAFFVFSIFSKVKWDEKLLFFLLGLLLISVSGFFYLCIAFITYEKLSLILLDVAIVGILELFFTCYNTIVLSFISHTDYQYSNEFKQQIISPDLLYFELIDRQNFQSCVQNQMQLSDSYKILKLIPQQANMLVKYAQMSVPLNKVWNSGYLLLYDFSSCVTQKSKSRIFSIIVNFIAWLLVLACMITPFIYLCLDLENIDNFYILLKITFFILIFGSKLINQIIHIIIFTKMDDFYNQIVSLTTLLEISNKFENNKIQRIFSTINIFCIQSILTWQQMRELTLGFVKKHFLNLNLIHTLDIIIIIVYTTALIVDYKGILWQKNYIIDSKFLLSYIGFSIIQRVLVSLVNLFNQNSGINKFLKYNKDQFYKIQQKLIYFKQIYPLLRLSTQDQISNILQKNDIQFFDFKNIAQFENALNQIKQINFRPTKSENPDVNETIWDDIKTQSIIEMKSIYEIKRNSNFYLKEDKTDVNQNLISEIQLEEKYLTNLIDVYKNVIRDMKEHENDNTIKFCGVPIEYAKLYALLTLLVPAVASYFVKQFINF